MGEQLLQNIVREYQELDMRVKSVTEGFIAAAEAYGADRKEVESLRTLHVNGDFRELVERMLTIRIQGR